MFDGEFDWFPRIPEVGVAGLPDPKAYIMGNTSWPLAMRLQLCQLFDDYCLIELFDPINWNTQRDRMMRLITNFIKFESYPEVKLPRAINARSNLAKILLGMIIKTLEDYIYPRASCHVKHMSFDERARMLWERHAHLRHHFASDYSSFEASIRDHLVHIELECIRRYFGKSVATFVWHTCYDGSTVENRYWTMTMASRRASGDMQTAFGNWLINLTVQTYLLYRQGFAIGVDAALSVEGDDTLASTVRPIGLTSKDYEDLGLIAKMETAHDMSQLSFCGVVVTGSALGPQAITDPLKILSQIGWSDSKYLNSSERVKNRLLVSKALSYGYQTPQCPVVRPLVDLILRSYSVDGRLSDVFGPSDPRRDYFTCFAVRDFQERFPRNITIEARVLMEEQFSINIELQMLCEELFDRMTKAGPFYFPFLHHLVPEVQLHEWRDQVTWEETERPAAVPSFTREALEAFVNETAEEERCITDWWRLASG